MSTGRLLVGLALVASVLVGCSGGDGGGGDNAQLKIQTNLTPKVRPTMAIGGGGGKPAPGASGDGGKAQAQ